jgi:hypothetical protein
MSNPFSDQSDSLVNSIRDTMNTNRANAEQMPVHLSTAAKAAGAEARGSNAKTIETRNTIYNKHMTNAAGDTPVSNTTRQEFEKIADQEWNRNSAD